MGAPVLGPGDFPKKYEKKRIYTPDEVQAHDLGWKDCWVSYFGKVYDLTSLLVEHPGPLGKPIIEAAGTDITHWFDPETRDPKTIVDPKTKVIEVDCPQGRFIHCPSSDPDAEYDDVDVPWWKEKTKYLVGTLASHCRKIRIVNLLTKHNEDFEVPVDETLLEIQERYKTHSAHCKSYTWKRLGIELDLTKTLTENGIPDETAEYIKLGMDPAQYIPAIHLYFEDDMTVA